MEDMKQSDEGAVALSPWAKIRKQINILDDALGTIDGPSEESAQARTYIVAQIEALKWAARIYEVG